MLGDRDRLQQVICNILTNAIKFTPEGGRVEVQLSLAQRTNDQGQMTNYAQIAIVDTGIGISAEALPHIFERFYQAEKSGSVKGLGLGLAIARHLVELHHGDIRAESLGEGRGATFTLNLPLIT